MTQEFHISVTPVGQNDYLVRTEQVAPGVPLAEELVTWPVADWLAAAGHLMNDPLQSVLQGDMFASSRGESDIARNSVNLVALGQQLYNALFQGTLRDSWITAQGIAQNHQQVLRLRLGLKDTRLARLPWEVMHAGDRPLATGPYVAFSRYQSGVLAGSRLPSTNLPKPTEEGGVKVLMIIASPTDQVRLDLLKQEAVKLQVELHRHTPWAGEGGNFPDIELTLLDQPGREELTQALEQGRYHVLHYSGHSNIGPNGGEIYLVSRRTGLTETLSGDDLAGLLVNNSVQMVVFNSCLGAYRANSHSGDETGERNLTESLVKRGIRSVLAMSERIPDEVAVTLTQLFYRNLNQGYSVDLCVSRVRQGLISAYGSHHMYWALPILYLQPEFDGLLSAETNETEEALSDYGVSARTNATAMYSTVADETELPLAINEMLPMQDSSDLDWLGEDTWGDLVDEIEYDDPTYAEDSALVSDLFRQLDNQKATSEQTPMLAELISQSAENTLPSRQMAGELAAVDETESLWGEIPEATQTAENFSEDWGNSTVTPSLPATWDRRRSQRRRWPILGAMGAGAIALLLGLNWWWQNRQSPVLTNISQIPNQSITNNNQPPVDLKTAATGIVTAIAMEKLNQGDLQGGLEAVEELLNRGVLPSAEVALKIIPQKQADNPAVNYLKGRLAWQSVQMKNKNYSIDDARRFWESAVQSEPESFEYRNALGFAYYAEKDLNRANDAWFQALKLALEQRKKVATSVPTKGIEPKETLIPRAGLALGFHKSATMYKASPEKQSQYINEAIKQRQIVINNDPVNFQIDKLSNNWLWTEKAISDWQLLLQAKSQDGSK
ncbi:cell division protein HetF [Fortiea contorta]|uniref:cell division protein HetF n=1 Tax=Fortiea contorta TaxID=1892405 RepID=UPI00034786BA|nr:cell division protein HetF [Fortiea contorta]